MSEPILVSIFRPTERNNTARYGLGATFLQDSKPVEYASKSLSAAEVNYAQIEKEMYAI